MFSYQLGRFRLQSELPLPLSPSASTSAQPILLRSKAALSFPVQAEAIRTYRRRDGTSSGTLYRQGEWYFAEIHEMKFALHPSGRTIEYSGPAVDLSQILIESILPEFLAATGQLTLHGSATLLGDEAVALIGPSGSGKSTLAAALSRKGHPLLSDDFVAVVEGARISAGSRTANLWPGTAVTLAAGAKTTNRTGKSVVEFDPPPAVVAPLGRIFLLEPSAHSVVEVTELGRDQAFSGLMESRYLLDGEDNRVLEKNLEAATTLVSAVPAARLRFPRDFGALAAVLETIERGVPQPCA